jgi:hypothetical protein
MTRLLLTALALLLASPAWAQVNLRLDLGRERFLLYESIPAVVEVTSYAAGELRLADEESTPWLQFDISRSNGEHIGMVGPGFLAGAAKLAGGQGIAKSVDLVAFYKIREPGRYRIRAMVKVSGIGGTFASQEKVIEVVSGHQLLVKNVGVKDEAGKESMRTYSVIEVLLAPQSWLYARVEDPQSGIIYGVIPMGEWVTFSPARAETDKSGNFHVLHQAQPRRFNYSVVTPQGTVVKRETYSNYNSVPDLRRGEDGQVKVVGGEAMGRPAPPPPPKSP